MSERSMNETPLKDLLRTAARLYRRGHFDQALTVVESALEWHPNHGRLWELRGLIQHARNELGEALPALETASVLVPLQPSARYALADCYASLGKSELAADLYRSLIVWPEVPAELLLHTAAGLNRLGQQGAAIKACREAARKEPELAQIYYDMGYYMGQCGYPAGMVEAMARKAVALEPDRMQFRVGLASFLYEHGRRQAAYQVIARFTAEQIGNIPGQCCLERIIDIFEAAGDWERSLLCRGRLRELEDVENNDFGSGAT